MAWNVGGLLFKSKSIRFGRLALESLEDRSVPALINSAQTLWFYQNLGNDPGLMKQAMTLWQQDNKTFQYNDMIKLFQFAASEHPTIQQNDLSDLQNLVSHGTAVGWMPQSVANLSSKVVNYNQANEFYQFQILSSGQPMSPNLLPSGALQAGNPSSLLNTLVNKWFLGMDHPDLGSVALNASGNLQGETAIGESNSTYQQATGVLWGSGGPTNLDIDQGIIGDCYFLSSLGATVTINPQTIQNMFINNGNGTYTVRFYVPNKTGTQYTPDYVTVDQMLPFASVGSRTTGVGILPAGYYFEYANGGTAPQGPKPGQFGGLTNLNTGPAKLNAPYQYPYATNYLWVALLEKAYTQFNAEIPISLTQLGSGFNLPNGANSYYVTGEGGYQANTFNNKNTKIVTYGALSEILGQPSSTIFTPSDSGTLTAATLINLLNSHLAVTIASYDNESGKGGNMIVTGHVYYITGYNSSTQEFTLVNPWGYQNTSEGKPGILNLPFDGIPSLNQDYWSVSYAFVP